MFAGHHRLARLTVLLDANNSQVDGPVDSITTIEPVAAKWRAFGWDAVDLDGHDVGGVAAALADGGRKRDDRPAHAGLPHLHPSWAGLPAAGRRRPLHQAACRPRGGGGRRTDRAELVTWRMTPGTKPSSTRPTAPCSSRTATPWSNWPGERPEIVCLSGDLTRQCEIDLFQEEFPDRFIHAGHGRGQHDRCGRGAGPAAG